MNKRILIVDDEKNIRTTLSAYLISLGYEQEIAVNGQEALDKLKDSKYDLVLLDIKMPVMDGIQVLKEVRRLEDKTNVIMMTAYGTIENAVESMKLGAVDFISKPFTLENLKTMIDAVFSREELSESNIAGFKELIEFAKKCINEKKYDKAIEYLKKAMVEKLESPEPQNLLGVLYELKGDLSKAGKHYRAALELDPTYRPSQDNLERVTAFKYMSNGIKFDSEEKEERK
ncbi:MAG: response regulator [Actinobacteria bacterium]|nr:response regulator [Actinomycetota bacterium]